MTHISKRKIFSAAILVAGTAIGAGMLALPVATSQGGFWPACAMYLLCGLFMAATGLLLLEICLWLPKDANLVTMARHLLGRKGKIVSWVLYLFLFYSLTIAYVAGGGDFIRAVVGGHLPVEVCILLFTLIFAPFVYIGTHAVDRVNLILMVGLGITYLFFVLVGLGHINPDQLITRNWPISLLALPVIFTSFSYQGIVPSLTTYLKRSPSAIRKAILIGTSIPFVVYVIWELLILGIVPIEGEGGLLSAKMHGQTAVAPLKHFVPIPYLYTVGQGFAFFALTTSFLGVTLGLLDFLADGLKVPKKGSSKLWLCLLVYLPPTIVAMVKPDIFLSALSYAGGIGCALLLGLLPVLMVWSGRYYKGYGETQRQLFGGKVLLLLLALFVLFELGVEIFSEFYLK